MVSNILIYKKIYNVRNLKIVKGILIIEGFVFIYNLEMYEFYLDLIVFCFVE